MTLVAGTVLLALLSGRARAQETGPPPATAPTATAPAAEAIDLLAPHVDNSTTFVVVIDLERFDAEAAERWVLDATRTTYTRPEMREAKLRQNEPRLAAYRSILADLKVLGARWVYIAAPVPGGPMPTMVVPNEAGVDAEAVRARLARIYRTPAMPQERMSPLAPMTVITERAVVGGTRTVVDLALMSGRGAAAPRAGADDRNRFPAVEEALAAVPDADAWLVVLPSIELRLTVQNRLARAEGDGSIPRGMAQELPHDMRWAAVAIETPPDLTARVVVQAADAAGAQRLADAARALFGWVRQTPGDAQQGVVELRLATEGDQVRLALTGEEIDRVLALDVAPLLRGQSEDALRNRAMARGQQIARVIRLYATQNGGQSPDELGALVDQLGMPRDLLKNPRRPDLAVGYTYLPAGGDALTGGDAGAGDRLLLYEVHEQWPEGGLVVVYADGRADVIEEPARFQDLLDAAASDGAARD